MTAPEAVAAERILAWSDLHADYRGNRETVAAVAAEDHAREALIVAGDVTDDLERLGDLLGRLTESFARVFYVPGNHELWVRRGSGVADSVEKFHRILELCAELGVATEPARVGNDTHSAWVVPLFSWYLKPGESPGGSLFLDKPGEDQTEAIWADNALCRWPALGEHTHPAEYFLTLNHAHLRADFEAPVISFSHFLPRAELIFPNAEVHATFRDGSDEALRHIARHDPMPQFNFSRVAGCTQLEAQIRRLGSKVHVYGHQHRNRNWCLDGVTYVSHCLGYPREGARDDGADPSRPRLVWSTEGAFGSLS